MEVEVTGEVMVSVVLFIFAVVAFIIFRYIFAKYKLGYLQPNIDIVDREDMEYSGSASQSGLDPMILRHLPVHVHKAVEYSKESVHCAVCLTEVVDGEKTRLLPKCNHGFHLDCIDMWFRSHSTCPLCREEVGSVSANGHSSESRGLPVNVLFWGRRDHVSTSGGRELEEITTGAFPSSYDTPSTSNRNEISISPPLPMPTRIVSLSWFWCREKVDVDIEHGGITRVGEDLRFYDSCTFD